MSEMVQYQNLIGGQMKDAGSGRLLDTINPATGEVWAKIPLSDRADANEAVAAARAAFPAWAALSPDERTGYLKRVAQLFVEYGDELAELESRDNGNPLPISKMAYGPGMEALWSRLAQQTVEASRGRTVPLDPTTLGFTLREPYGVIAAIVPFNMPLGMASSKIATALAAGNTVVVKPPDQASVSSLRFAELVNKILPPGAVNFVSGLGDVGDAMVRHPDVAKVTMTGSSPTAKLIQAAAAETLTPAIFELGGKSPNIVLDDADLELHHSGSDRRVDLRLQRRPGLCRRLPDLGAASHVRRGGGPHRTGCRVDRGGRPGGAGAPRWARSSPRSSSTKSWGTSRTARRRLSFSSVAVTVRSSVPDRPGGYWVEPTLFMAKDNSPRICREEIFGPVGADHPLRHRRRGDRASPTTADSVWRRACGPATWLASTVTSARSSRATSGSNTYLQMPPRDALRRYQGERLRPRRRARLQPRKGRSHRTSVGFPWRRLVDGLQPAGLRVPIPFVPDWLGLHMARG